MNKRLKKRFAIAIGGIVFFWVGFYLLNGFVENKFERGISQLPENIKIQYETVRVNILNGSLYLVNPEISIYGKTTQKINIQIKLNDLCFDGLSYWDYFFNNILSLKNITINQPEIRYIHNKGFKPKANQNGFLKGLNQTILVGNFKINNGSVEVLDASKDSLLLKSDAIDFNSDTIEVHPSKYESEISYNDFDISFENLYYKLNDFENLLLGSADIKDGESKFRELVIKTKFTKELLSKQIAVERDHFDLKIDSLEIQNQDFGIEHDSLFYFKSKHVNVYQPNFNIYRDKLVADDLSYKPLFSKKLRGLGFKIALNKVYVNNATVMYTEKVKADTEGGKLLFSKLNAEIKNLSNAFIEKDEVASAKINTIFMENTPINVLWDFDVNNRSDEFIFKTEIGKLDAVSMNPFMEPNLNVRLEGEIIKTYFTINGNNQTSQVDLKLQYNDFDVLVLKENGKEKNKLLSSIVNLFVAKDSHDNSSKFRHGSKKGIERDRTKSVFNYLWINIKEGMLVAMTGNGKEK